MTDASSGQNYEISDIKYTTPKCVINGTTAMDNILGHLRIENDLLGNNLIITYNLSSSFYSCYLCSQYGQYCGTSVSSEYIYLTTNILYNLQLLTLDSNNTPQKVYTFNVESELGYKSFNSNITIPLNMIFPSSSNKTHCSKTYSFILVALITVDAVNNKEIVTITQPPKTIVLNDTSFLCISSAQYTQIGIDCNMVPVIQPIRYTVDKCVDIIDSNSSTSDNNTTHHLLTYYPPLYWYSEMVFDESMTTSGTILCGERYDSRLFKSGLYQAICYNSERHQENISKYWWMNLFIQLLSLESNIDASSIENKSQPMREVIYEARDLLERQCDPFHTIMRGSPVVLAKINSLYGGRVNINQTELCLDLYHYFEKNYNQTRGDDSFVHLFNLWYIELFKFIIYPNKIVETQVVLAVGITFFFLLFLVMAFGILQFRLKVKVKKQSVSIDDPYNDYDEYLAAGNDYKKKKDVTKDEV